MCQIRDLGCKLLAGHLYVASQADAAPQITGVERGELMCIQIMLIILSCIPST